MSVDLKSKLLPSIEKTAELEIFLGTYFSSSSQTEPNKIVHGSELIVEYYGKNNKKHKTSEIKSIYPTHNEKSALLNNIEEKARDALSISLGDEVSRSTLFSPYEIKGSYRFNNKFQIIEVPENAPKPNQAWADHPFILEYSYTKSPHNLINSYRRQKTINEFSLLLNVFMKGGIKSLNNSAHKDWVLITETEEDEPWQSHYLQHGYALPDDDEIDKDEHGFTVCNTENIISETDPYIYYSENSISIGETFSLPSNLNELINKFTSLHDNDKECFLRASFWKRVGSDTFYISSSNAYITLVNAIESLIPHEKADWYCISCKKEIKKGLTQLFHDFVETYAPGLSSIHRKELYAIRSKYTHGKRLMPGDMNETGFRFNPTNNYDSANYRTLSMVVQIAMLNWLLSK